MNQNISEPLVSVVVPVYHVVPWLRQCLDSVKGQTYASLEVILVDDGSMDECSAICDEYVLRDSRFFVIHQKNRGLGNARNTGMDFAHGKYIIFLDSDDYWQPETIEQLCRTAESHALQAVVFSASVLFDGVESFPCPDYHHTIQNGVVKTGSVGLKTDWKSREYYAQACLRFYLLSYLRENNLCFDEGIIHEDESFSFLACLQAERAMWLGESFYTRRYRKGSIMLTPDPARSAEGYAAAIKTISRYSKEADFENEKLHLCAVWIKRYTAVLFSLYHRARRQHKDADTIRNCAETAFRTVRESEQPYPLRLRLIVRYFYTGYVCWYVKSAVRKIFSM